MSLLYFNMISMTVACVVLLVGFSARDSKWGPGLMLLGIVAVMAVIVYDIQVLSARA